MVDLTGPGPGLGPDLDRIGSPGSKSGVSRWVGGLRRTAVDRDADGEPQNRTRSCRMAWGWRRVELVVVVVCCSGGWYPAHYG